MTKKEFFHRAVLALAGNTGGTFQRVIDAAKSLTKYAESVYPFDDDPI